MLKRHARDLIAVMGRTRVGKLILWKALSATGVERLAIRTHDGRFMVSTRDNMIALTLFLEGTFDKKVVDESCSMASAYLGRSNLTYVDVGANIGSNTVYALLHPAFSNALCFEPNAINFSNLVHTVEMNGLAEQVRCVRTALGETTGHARLDLSTINFGDHHIMPDGASEDMGESIAITTLDASLAKEEVERVGLVCIDVQGYEAQVLDGASVLLRRDIPVLCELTPHDLRRCAGYDRFFDIAEREFNWFVDMGKPTGLRAISELRDFAESLAAGGHSDVFMTKRRW